MNSSRRRLPLTLAAIASVAVVTTLVAWLQLQPPARPPLYEGARPDESTAGYEAVTESILIEASPAAVHAYTNDPDLALEDVVQFDGFPAVVGTLALSGDWIPGSRDGDRRRVQFADGHYLAEEVLVDDPERFRYMIWGFTSFQRFAVDHGVAEFTYQPEGTATRLSWTYTLLPTSELTRGAVRAFLADTMRPMMTATLMGYRNGIEG
jgi:hypothetical protein